MASIVRYSLLIMSMYLCSCSSLEPLFKDFHWKSLTAPLKGDVGRNISIPCATEKTKQDGVYMWKMQHAQTEPQKIFYFYKDGTLTVENSVPVNVSGIFPNLTVTFMNLSVTDVGLYWCEFNLEEKITPGTVSILWMTVTEEESPKPPLIFIALCAIICLLITCFFCVFLRTKRCCDAVASKQSHDSPVYEEMNRNRTNTSSTLINPEYQSSRHLK